MPEAGNIIYEAKDSKWTETGGVFPSDQNPMALPASPPKKPFEQDQKDAKPGPISPVYA